MKILDVSFLLDCWIYLRCTGTKNILETCFLIFFARRDNTIQRVYKHLGDIHYSSALNAM